MGDPALLMTLPPGRDAIRETLKLMRGVTRGEFGKKSPAIRQTAAELVQDLPNHAGRAEVAKLWHFVLCHIRFTPDITEVETLYTPEKVLENGFGDCDDKCVLLAAMLESIGHATRFVAASLRPPFFSHVFVETQLGSKWVACDAVVEKPMGWRPPGILESIIIYNRG